MIRIQSKQEGFRRCVIAHPEASTDYADDFFTKEQLARLKAEPMLIVLEVPNPPEKKKSGSVTALEPGKKK